MRSAGPIKDFLRRTRRRFNQSLGRDVRVPIQHRCRTEFLGSDYGGWCICPEGIGPESVIYSFGVGEDVSFDLALIARFGAQVHAFDPTPKSIRWIKRQATPREFHFHELGIADFDGVATFALPRPDYVSYSLSDESPDGERVVQAKVKRLSTIMRDLGHQRIDILKMDIEGAEYAVIDDIARTGIQVGQFLVEFHHTIGDAAEVARTAKAIETLNRLGLRLFFNSVVGREFSFIHVDR